MKVYVLKLVLGKTTNYDQNGKLKNQTITAKYGEMELENILTDQNWNKLGACEISCVKAYDHPDLKNIPELVDSINERIKKDIQQGIKPKSEIELLKEQNEMLLQRLERLEENKSIESPKKAEQDENIKVNEKTEKEIRKDLFAEAENLGLNPAKTIKTELLKDLVEKAKQGN